jgi:hypothetical protein
MRKISALICVYNDNVFTKACLENIQLCADQIVIVEGSWNGARGTYDYGENKSSDDGTRRIVEQFAALYPDKVVLTDSIGDEECCWNLGLSFCEHNWVLNLGSDEFYWPEQINALKGEFLENTEKEGVDFLRLMQYTFYFNFRHYMHGRTVRLFNTANGVYYSSANGVGDILEGGNRKVADAPANYCHFQWVGDRHKVLCSRNIDREIKVQRAMGEDPDKVMRLGGWRWWLKHIYSQFDGKNLAALEEKNRGSVNPWSFLHEEHRVGKLKPVDHTFVFPGTVSAAPWFNPREEGLVTLEHDLA